MKNEPFYPSRFYWRDCNKKDTKKACDILNTLTEEQIWAVEKYGDSRYHEGQEDEAEQYQD